MKRTTYNIPESESNLRLDRWLKIKYSSITQSFIEKLCRKGEIKINSKKIKSSYKLVKNDILIIPNLYEKKEEKLNDLKRTEKDFLSSIIIFEDEHFFIINKPNGIPSQGGSKQNSYNIADLFKRYNVGSIEQPRLIHRLDKDTSGLMVIGKTRKSTTLLSSAFKERKVNKKYWAMLNGNILDDEGEISLVIAKSRNNFEKMISVHPNEKKLYPEAKLSVTRFKVVERIQKKFTWVSLEPITGKKHQLRFHMSEIGSPILGETKYNINTDNKVINEKNILDIFNSKKLFLHSRCISFKHPFKNENISFKADLPDHMKKIWNFFGLNINHGD